MSKPTILKAFGLQNMLRTTRCVLVLTPWLLHLFASDIILSLLLPVSFLAPTAVYNVSSQIAYWVWWGIQKIFTKFNRARITVSGAKLPRQESAIVVSNHVSWADFYLIQQLALDAGMLSRCRWFAKQQLKWVPFLGWGLWAMGMPLISRRWDKDQRELDRVFRGPKMRQWPMWLISYSEATRYTAQKYTDTVQWCKANNKPVPRHTLYPRTRGFVTTVKQLGSSSSIKAVYDVTLAYAHRDRFFEAPEMWETLSEPRLDRDWRFHVHVERFDIRDLAGKTDSELSKWLEDRWIAKSKQLEKLQNDLENGVEWGSEMSARETLAKIDINFTTDTLNIVQHERCIKMHISASMDNYELLVHIMAPSTVRDDHRYRSIAQAVAEFEPARVMRLCLHGTIEEAPRSRGSAHPVWPSEVASFGESNIVVETPAPALETNDRRLDNSPSDALIFEDYLTVGKDGREAEWQAPLSQRLSSGGDPTSLGGLGPQRARHQPNAGEGRPKTAPAAPESHLLVPASVGRKRAKSLSSSFESGISAISESSPLQVRPSIAASGCVDASSGAATSSVRLLSDHVIQKGGDFSSRYRPAKRRRMTDQNDADHVMQDASNMSIADHIEQPHSVWNRSLDWTSSSPPSKSISSTCSPSSTTSPSQPVNQTFYRAGGSTRLDAGATKKITTVDLVTPDDAIGCTPPFADQHNPKSIRRSQNPSLDTPMMVDNPTSGLQDDERGPTSVALLPSVISSRPPPASMQSIVPHVTESLQDIVDYLPFAKYFRPEYVRRDVKELERGYWRLDIRIGQPAEIALARQSPTKEELLSQRRKQLNGSSVAKRLENWQQLQSHWEGSTPVNGSSSEVSQPQHTPAIWTEAEFRSFWENMTAFVQAGKAGWRISAVKDVVECSEQQTAKITVKVYTWGQLVAHVWLAMWVLSDKLIAHAPMTWIAGDETMVIRMTGDRRRQGGSGPWTRKGAEGEKGSWGVM